MKSMVFMAILAVLAAGCQLAPVTDKSKLVGEWVYSRFVFSNGSETVFNGNIATSYTNGGLYQVNTNSSYDSFTLNSDNSCLWTTYYTNGSNVVYTGSWTINEQAKTVTMTRLNFTNTVAIWTYIYSTYSYKYTYSIVSSSSLNILGEKDSYTCINDDGTPTNYSVTDEDIFAVSGISLVGMGKK